MSMAVPPVTANKSMPVCGDVALVEPLDELLDEEPADELPAEALPAEEDPEEALPAEEEPAEEEPAEEEPAESEPVDEDAKATPAGNAHANRAAQMAAVIFLYIEKAPNILDNNCQWILPQKSA